MDDCIIENYLGNIQDIEPEYMTEGMREFLGKFNKAVLKKTVDRIHNAFSKGDGDSFNAVAKETAIVARKIPKVKEVQEFAGNFAKDHPEFQESMDLSRRVIKNSFKIKDKAKLELAALGAGMAAWVKSKGGKINLMQVTKTTLQDIGARVNNIYDTGFDDMDATTPEEEEMKKAMASKAQKQEKIEMIVVGVILAVLSAVVIWAGMSLWAWITSPAVGILVSIIAILVFVFKVLVVGLEIALPTALAILTFMKVRQS
jgi:hypothetical protein